MDATQREHFLSRYLAMWHEPDAAVRRSLVKELWAPEAENLTRTFNVRGDEQIIQRVDTAHAEWVEKRDFVFRSTGNSDGHNHLVKFHWEMLPRGGGPLQARGLDIFVLNENGKIRSLFQFAEPLPF